MKVRQLISELKKMPQHLEVGFAHHDNNEEEVAGWVYSLDHFKKSEATVNDPAEQEMFDSMPDSCVILRG